MKLMNELEAEISGEVVEILVENGTPVEYNQVLMLVRPASPAPRPYQLRPACWPHGRCLGRPDQTCAVIR